MQRDAIDEDYSIRLVLQFQTKTIKFKVELQEQPSNQNRTKKDMGNYVKHIKIAKNLPKRSLDCHGCLYLSKHHNYENI